MERRILPVGVQDFEKLMDKNCLYVDKTAWIYRLVHEAAPFFLSRPRRFGKSLLLSTIKAYWEGKASLFRGLAMDRLEEGGLDAIKPHPVFYLDFEGKNYRKEGGLEEKLNLLLLGWEELYGNQYNNLSLDDRFNKLLSMAHEKTGQRCVVLVDEYDKPLLETMDNPRLLEHNKALFKGFFGNLKSCDAHIEFIFITGITKFHKVSIFSALNNLKDISVDQEYASICGITEEEMVKFFDPEIHALADKQGIGYDKCLHLLKKQYDGYHFHQNAEGVYNPYSLMNAFFSKEFSSFWYETGTPGFLTKRIKDIDFDLRKFTDKTLYASRSVLSDYTDDLLNPLPLLYQSGYLTIIGYDDKRMRYQLGFPNKEVEEGFLGSLIPEYVPSAQEGLGTDIYTLDSYVESGNLEGIRNVLTALFAGIVYTKEDDPFENYFQAVIYLVFTLLGKFAQCEMHTYKGRIDCRVMTDEYVYLFEFKRDDTAANALKQIDGKGYALPFQADRRTLFKIGAVFDSKERILTDWKATTENHGKTKMGD